MGTIYRKSLKGIDELAFKTNGLPMRLMSYLMAVDGETSVEQLMARNPQLPSMDVVLSGLVQQGFVEVAGSDANIVQMNNMRVGNGASIPMQAPPQNYAPAQAPMQQPMQTMQQPMQQPMQPNTNMGYSPELDLVKANMIKDVSGILGTDAGPVIQKIQAARTKDDLFGSMIGIKKIITIYANAGLAEKFAARYQSLI
jgi:hypothetical protein